MQEEGLLKELKTAYKRYIEGDVLAFDHTLRDIALVFAANPGTLAKQIRMELGLRAKKNK